jgi:SynChlorMet cassette radical SAM/SPASM protein ScmE
MMKPLRTPRIVDISITNKCNLRCLYCFHFSGAGDIDRDLPYEEWARFMEELGACAVMRVILGGGEPFYRKDLKEIIESIVRNRMRYTILTNGTLITDRMAGFIASMGRCDTVQVSIDGSTPSTHDYCRGKGNFERALRGIRHLRNNSVPVSVRVTIHRGNVNDLGDIAKLLLEDLALPEFSTNSATYMGLCRQNTDMVRLSVVDRMTAMTSLLRLDKKYGNRITAAAGPLAEAKGWARMEQLRKEGKARQRNCGYLKGCNGTFNKIAVRADGIIVPCTMLGHIALGRINQDRLADIWQGHPELKKLRERGKIPLGDFELCRGCEYAGYCTGSCPALAYTMTGKDNHPCPDACLRIFLDSGGRLPDADLFEEHSEVPYG